MQVSEIMQDNSIGQVAAQSIRWREMSARRGHNQRANQDLEENFGTPKSPASYWKVVVVGV